jgi:hypothetical protein
LSRLPRDRLYLSSWTPPCLLMPVLPGSWGEYQLDKLTGQAEALGQAGTFTSLLSLGEQLRPTTPGARVASRVEG